MNYIKNKKIIFDYKYLIIFIFAIFFMFCKENTFSIQQKNNLNPLDTIVGDKFMKENSIIRGNNFIYFHHISRENLARESELYNIIKINNETFLLQQKKIYSAARNFNAVLKIRANKVAYYHIFNDYKIIDYHILGDSLIILSDNFEMQEIQNSHWKTKNQINIEKFDAQLNKVWTYEMPTKTAPIRANALKDKQNNDIITCLIDVILGSTMSYETNELKLSSIDGKLISFIKIGYTNFPAAIGATMR